MPGVARILLHIDAIAQRLVENVEQLEVTNLQQRCDKVSPTMLNRRLKELRLLQLVDHESSGYGHTRHGQELGEQLTAMDVWATQWAKNLGD